MRLSLDKNLHRSALNKKEIRDRAARLWKEHRIAFIPTDDMLDDGRKWVIEAYATELYGPTETPFMS